MLCGDDVQIAVMIDVGAMHAVSGPLRGQQVSSPAIRVVRPPEDLRIRGPAVFFAHHDIRAGVAIQITDNDTIRVYCLGERSNPNLENAVIATT